MRLTKKSVKFVNAYEWNREPSTKTFVQLGMNKLGQLEDIEEELGIDLVTLFKALKNNKIWVRTLKNNFHRSIECREDVRIESFFWLNVKTSDGPWVDYRIKDYGKTWALTKEELEQC